MKKIYLLLVSIVLIGSMSCHKDPKGGGGSGNVPGKGVDPPSGSVDGVTFTNGGKSAIFNLYAPGKKSVGVIGEFNNWSPKAMQISTDGNRWWVQVDDLDPAKQYAYQYLFVLFFFVFVLFFFL